MSDQVTCPTNLRMNRSVASVFVISNHQEELNSKSLPTHYFCFSFDTTACCGIEREPHTSGVGEGFILSDDAKGI